MDSKRIFIDQDIYVDDEVLPDTYSIKIKSNNMNLIGAILTPGGKGKKGTVIILHGFPGYEDNHDIAHSLRRCGLNVVIFHYRGSWGVDGKFSFSHCIEDVKSVIDYVCKEEIIKKYNIDKNNIYLVGHSMGGFLALTHCNDSRIKATVAISPYDFGLKGCIMKECKEELNDGIEMFTSATEPLNGTNTMELIDECLSHGEKWNLQNKADKLAKENLLIIGAKKDVIGPIELHYTPLVNEINKYENKLKTLMIDTDHSYSNKRIYLTKMIAEYIEDMYKNKFR